MFIVSNINFNVNNVKSINSFALLLHQMVLIVSNSS